MPMPENQIRYGFLLAGAVNIVGVLGASLAFTSPHLALADPAAMSNFGLAVIILWGCAYLATADHWQRMKWLVAVFCVEKLLYGVHWGFWIVANQASLGEIYTQDFMSGVFLSVYGPSDFLFAIFFAVAFLRASAASPLAEPAR